MAESEERRRTIVAAGVVWRDGRVLLTRRMKGQHLAGFWEFPGGKWEAGESPEQTVVRECEEECGILVEVGDILDVTFHRYPEKDVLLMFYDCRWKAGEVEHREVDDHVWCDPADLQQYELPPADIGVANKIRARAKQ